MAEVVKKEIENEIDTSKIKKEEKNNDIKKKDKKEEKKSSKTKGEKKSLIARFFIFCNGVKDEFKKVHWTSKNDMVKYSIACILFIIFSALFFFGIDKLFRFIFV